VSGTSPQPPQPSGTFGPAQPAGNGIAIAALVLGIVGLALFCLRYVSIPCGVLAIIFGVIGKNKAKQGAPRGGMAMAGLIMGCIGIVLTVLWLAGVAALLGFARAKMPEIAQQLQNMPTSAP